MQKQHPEKSPLHEMLHGLAAARPDSSAFLHEAERVCRFSTFVRKTCSLHPETLHDLVNSEDLFASYPPGDYLNRVSAAFNGCPSEEEADKALRILRRREMIRIAWRDLSLRADLLETLDNLSSFAETCVDKTLEYLFRAGREQYGTPVAQTAPPNS